jgi:hypothetical protein
LEAKYGEIGRGALSIKNKKHVSLWWKDLAMIGVLEMLGIELKISVYQEVEEWGFY